MNLIQASYDDVDELCDELQTWDVELMPMTRVNTDQNAGTVIQTGTLDCQYMYSRFSVGLSMRGSPPHGLVTFNLQEPTTRHYWWRGHDLDSTMAWVFPFGGELRSISAPGFRVHTLSATEEYIAAVAADCGIDLPPISKRPEVFQVPDDVLQPVLYRLNAMRDSSSPFSFDAAHEILRLLVPQWLHREARQTTRRPSIRARDRALSKSLEVIDASDMQALTMQVLLNECHVTERTLQLAYRERFATSPAAFIKSLRLARVRSVLRRSDPGQHNVGDIAADFGFWHLGQFASDYRRRFGERPSETLARQSHR